MAAACRDNAVAGARAAGAALGHVEIEPAVALQQLGAFQASTFHANGGGHGPGVEDLAGRGLHRQAVRGQLGHAAAVHIEKAASILGDMGRVNGVDTQTDRLAPRPGGVIGMNDAQAAFGREVDVVAALVLAEVGRPDGAIEAVESGGYRTPVDQVAGVPDQQPRGVVKAGVGKVEVVADANGAGVGMVAAQDGIAIDVCGLRRQQAGLGSESEGSGVQNKAAAG